MAALHPPSAPPHSPLPGCALVPNVPTSSLRSGSQCHVLSQENLRQYVDRVFHAITESGVSCPTVMCDIFFSLREAAAKRFQGEAPKMLLPLRNGRGPCRPTPTQAEHPRPPLRNGLCGLNPHRTRAAGLTLGELLLPGIPKPGIPQGPGHQAPKPDFPTLLTHGEELGVCSPVSSSAQEVPQPCHDLGPGAAERLSEGLAASSSLPHGARAWVLVCPVTSRQLQSPQVAMALQSHPRFCIPSDKCCPHCWFPGGHAAHDEGHRGPRRPFPSTSHSQVHFEQGGNEEINTSSRSDEQRPLRNESVTGQAPKGLHNVLVMRGGER
ncbi:hypothetical protein P7K49_000013 [Saguinus oedipus]|uniref:Ras-GAP domain-containing protein n=1 Tax=Saguinus oedipus TaxID=9490 RepID=A0ABQ9WE36_SAGOE|nr:hypothetical protein P7K49_000013 [Saguinus oedipus]